MASLALRAHSLVALMLIVSVMAPTEGSSQVRADSAVRVDRTTLVGYLDSTRKAFLADVAGLSGEQLRFKPTPTQWSVAEVIEHLALVERSTFARVRDQIVAGTPARPELKGTNGPRFRDLAIRLAVANRTTQRFTSPEAFVPANAFATTDDALGALRSARDQMIDYVQRAPEDLRGHFAPHPVLGVIDAQQWLLSIGAHMERHHDQLRELKAAAGFPRTLPIPPTNPRATIKQFVGPTAIDLSYSRPGVKGRTIFGALVPWRQVWRTGADNATKISFSTPVTLNGARIPAGTYELFTIPDQSEWTVIVHANKSQWGSYTYDQANDIARVRATPVILGSAVETFSINVSDITSRSATLNIEWGHTRVPVTIEVDVAQVMAPHIETLMRAPGRKPYFLAAMFYFENNIDIDRAAEWIGAAVAEQPNHIGMLHRQALILAAKGDTVAALAAAQRSLDGARTSSQELRDEYTRLNESLMTRLRNRRQP